MSSSGRSLIDEVLSKVNIIDLISTQVDLKRAGKNFKGLCPFHNEKSPSFTVSDDRQRYHCFGCQADGDAINFVMSIENLDFLDAIDFLAEKYGIDISNFKNENVGKEYKKEFLELARESANFYYKCLKSSKKALEYVEQRGISEGSIKRFGIGYAPSGWDNLFKFFRPRGDKQLKLLKQIGLLYEKSTKGSYYDVFRDRLIFPIQNVQGKVIGFGGRIIDEGNPKYLNSPESPIFDKGSILYGLNIAKNSSESRKRILVTEGYIDVIMLNQFGFDSAVATLGTALSERHASTLARYTDEIVVCYDGDKAGVNAAIRSVDILKNSPCPVKVLILPDGKDPDDYIKSEGIELFKGLVSNAKGIMQFYLDVLFEKYGDSDDGDILHVVGDFVSMIATLESPTERDLQIKRLSETTGVSIEAIREEVQNTKSRSKIIKHVPTTNGVDEVTDHSDESMYRNLENKIKKTQKKEKSTIYNVELRMLQIALSSQQNANILLGSLKLSSIVNEGIVSAITNLMEYYEINNTSFDVNKATDVMDLDIALKLSEELKKMPSIDNIQKEVSSIVSSHNLLLIDREIEFIKSKRNETARLIKKDPDNKELQELLGRLIKRDQDVRIFKSKINSLKV